MAGKISSDTSSNDPKMLNSRVFIGNLPSEKVTRREVEAMFAVHGTVLGVSLHKSYGFVQFDCEDNAKNAVDDIHGKTLEGNVLDVNLAALRRKDATSTKTEIDVSKSKGKSSSSKMSSKQSSSESRSHHSSSRYHDERSRRDRSRDRSRERERDRLYRRRSRSPPYMPHDMELRARFRPMDRMHGYPPPPFREPFFDFPPPRDPYFFPREDMYDMRDRYSMSLPGRMRDPFAPAMPDLYDRMSPLPLLRERDIRDREPRDREPRDRDPRDREPRYDDLPPTRPRSYSPLAKKDFALSLSSMALGKVEKPTDMEIIVVNRQQKEYADLICGRVKFFGLVVDTVNLSHTVSLADALDAAANRGLLYAIIVTSQHELHRSVTLTILHGRNPQEHKNMPLEDALSLVDRDFQRYTVDVREGHIPPRRQKNELSSLLSQAASGGQLSTEQLQQVIEALQKQKQQSNETQLLQQSSATQPQVQLPPKDDIQRQQADLQAKILSLLGSNAVVPSSTNQHSSRAAPHSGYDNASANGRVGDGLGVGGFGGSGGGMRGGDGGGREYSRGSFGSGY